MSTEHLIKGWASNSPPTGYTPILESVKGGYHKREGDHYVTWYPSVKHAEKALDHHQGHVERAGAHAQAIATHGPSKATPEASFAISGMAHHQKVVAATRDFIHQENNPPAAPAGYKPIAGNKRHGHIGVNDEGKKEVWYPTKEHAENARWEARSVAIDAARKVEKATPGTPEHAKAVHAHERAADHARLHDELYQRHVDEREAGYARIRAEHTAAAKRSPRGLAKSADLHHPPPGFSPIPGSTHQGFHKQVDGKWEQWYPSADHATQARDHHYAEADAHADEARNGGHHEAGRKFHERMASKHRNLGDLAEAAANRRRKGTPSHASDEPPAGFSPVKRKNMMGETVTDPHQLHHKVEADGSESYWSPSPEHAAASVKHHEARAENHAVWAAKAEDAGLYADGHQHLQEIHQEIADGARHLAAPLHKARSARLVRGLIALFRSLPRAEAVPMSKGLPDQLVQADPSTIDVLEKWDEDGYTCQVRKAAGGAQYLTIEGGNLPIPYHAIVADADAARRTASNAIPLFRRNRSPREGVYRRTGTRKQGPRTGYGVFV